MRLKRFVNILDINRYVDTEKIITVFAYVTPIAAMISTYAATNYGAEYFYFAIPVSILMIGLFHFSYNNPKGAKQYLINSLGIIPMLFYFGLVYTVMYFCFTCTVGEETKHLIDFVIFADWEGLNETVAGRTDMHSTFSLFLIYYCPMIVVIYRTLNSI